MGDRDIKTPPVWFGEWQEKKKRQAPRKGVTTKNCVLMSITTAAMILIITGFGILDTTGSIAAAYPALLPGAGWLAVFFYINRDRI